MAKLNNNGRAALFTILTLSVLLIVAVADSRPVLRIGVLKPKQAPECDTVFSVRKGDTCFNIAQNFGLSKAEFDSINPNVDCSALFISQWLCIHGTA